MKKTYLLDANVFISASRLHYAALQSALGTVAEWATSQQYEPAAISNFLAGADYYLVAHALAHGHVVVTQEVAAHTTRRIKIPNACIGLGVRHMMTSEMLRTEKARFVLGRTAS